MLIIYKNGNKGEERGKMVFEAQANNVNSMLKQTSIRVGRRYGYYAVDIYDKHGFLLDTIEAGLSRKQALSIIHSIYYVLLKEQARKRSIWERIKAFLRLKHV